MSQTDYRNRHDRSEQHFGTMPATLVGLSSALDAYPAGTTIEDIIWAVHLRLTRLEGATVVVGTLKADAWVIYPYFLADAIVRRVQAGSFTADAISMKTAPASFAADAWIGLVTITGSLSADAVVKKEMSGSLTADSWIGTVEAGGEATLGDLTLADESLGG